MEVGIHTGCGTPRARGVTLPKARGVLSSSLSSLSSSSSSPIVSHCRSHLPGGLGAGRRPPKSYYCPLKPLLCGAEGERRQYIFTHFEYVLTSNNKYLASVSNANTDPEISRHLHGRILTPQFSEPCVPAPSLSHMHPHASGHACICRSECSLSSLSHAQSINFTDTQKYRKARLCSCVWVSHLDKRDQTFHPSRPSADLLAWRELASTSPQTRCVYGP